MPYVNVRKEGDFIHRGIVVLDIHCQLIYSFIKVAFAIEKTWCPAIHVGFSKISYGNNFLLTLRKRILLLDMQAWKYWVQFGFVMMICWTNLLETNTQLAPGRSLKRWTSIPSPGRPSDVSKICVEIGSVNIKMLYVLLNFDFTVQKYGRVQV